MSTADTEVAEVEGARSQGRSRSGRRHRVQAQGLAALAALGAAFSGAAPTGTPVADVVLTAAFAGLVTLASGKARRVAVLGLPLAAVVLATGWGIVPALGSAVAAIVGGTRRRRVRTWGAATAALGLQAVLRAGDVGFHGLPALVVAAAILPVLVSAYRASRTRQRRTIRWVGYALAAIAALIGLGYGALVLSVAGDVDRATTAARTGLTATRTGDTDAARSAFQRAARDFATADDRLNSWWASPARAVPVLGQHARALGSASSEGRQLAATAEETVAAADYQALRYTSGRFDLARIAAVQDPLARTVRAVDEARVSLDDHDSPWLVAPLADALDELDGELADAQDEGELAAQAIDVVPAMLGAEGPRRYFVAFVTPAELRGSGGFMGSWAEVTADGGQLRLTASGPVRQLYEGYGPEGVDVTGPPDYLSRYGRYLDDRRFIGDFGYSPHFPSSAEVMAQAYPQVGGQPLDGVISIDPIALAALLEFTGPIEAPAFGQTLTSDNAADFLLRDNYRLFPDSDAQNEALAELVDRTFDALTTGDLPAPARIADVLSPATQAGRLRMWSPDPDEEAFIARLGADGAFPAPHPSHDFLALSSQNSGNNKIDVYQSRTVDYRVDVDGGRLDATARITVRNDAPIDGSVPEFVVGNGDGDPVGTNRMLLSVHTPHRLEGATLDGEAVGMESQVEAGYRVYTADVAVPPGQQVVLELELTGALDVEAGYVLDLAPHPTVNPDELTVTVTDGDGDPVTRGPITMTGRGMVALEPDGE